jgi:3-deoxy-manno-octulosonate cytidylyltransferase (CMP-KDO synthetase)
VKIGIIIPARFKSTRFPGKPLTMLGKKSMVHWVYDRCRGVIEGDPIYVATDDQKIAEHCKENGLNFVMTSSNCLTGTDRVYEAVKALGLDGAINVQGDEPLISSEDIKKVKDAFLSSPDSVINAWAPVRNSEEYFSVNIPKVVLGFQDKLLYMSRSPIPGNKLGQFVEAKKQICIYGFSKEALFEFYKQDKKTGNESHEDIEILRFLELGHEVKMIEVESGSIAIDVPSDCDAVLKELKRRNEI